MGGDMHYLWDVFLAHASPDKTFCEELADALERAAVRTFIDTKGLDTAADWHKELPDAQRKSRITLVYVSPHTDAAWFQRSEIVRAIQQKRFANVKHEIVPIWGNGKNKPYGTEQLVGIDPNLGIDHIVSKVLQVLQRRFHVDPGERFDAETLPPYLMTGLLTKPKKSAAPSQALRPERQVVPFEGRVKERALLNRWADAPGIAIKLVFGPAGTGKTRLGLQWLKERRDRGDVAGFLREITVANAEAILARKGKTVVGIDYAETRDGLRVFLGRVAQHWERSSSANLKVLLFARNEGDWWESLRLDRTLASLMDDTPRLDLQPLVQASSRAAEFRRAARAFAAHFDVVEPTLQRDLDQPAYERALFIHIAALLRVLSRGSDPLASGNRFIRAEEMQSSLLDGLLRREADIWHLHCRGDQDWLPQKEALELGLTALTLRGGATRRSELEQWLPAVLPDRAHARLFRHVLEACYEGSPECWRDAIQPDLLGEHLVCRTISGSRQSGPGHGVEFIELALGELGVQWTHAFTVLGRAEPHHPEEVGRWISKLLSADPVSRGGFAFMGALAAGSRTAHSTIGRSLASALTRASNVGQQSQTLASLIYNLMPQDTVSLRELAVWATSRCISNSELDAAERGSLNINLGTRLSALGKPREALAAAREAVNTFMELNSQRPEAFLSELALSLNNFGTCSFELGERQTGVEAIQWAVRLRRGLVSSHPEMLPDLAMSLSNWGAMLFQMDQCETAVNIARTIVNAYRSLASHNPNAFVPQLGRELTHLGAMLSEHGEHDEALEVMREAVGLFRSLSSTRPDGFLPYLAESLNNLGVGLSVAGELAGALDVTREAVQLLRLLAADRPDAFIPILARSLYGYGRVLLETGDVGGGYRAFVEGAEALMPYFENVSTAHQSLLAALCEGARLSAEHTGEEPGDLSRLQQRFEAVLQRNPKSGA